MAAHKKRKKKKQYRSVFPILYPSKLGTPYGYRPGSTNEFGGNQPSTGTGTSGTAGTGGSGAGSSGGGMAGPVESHRPKPGRARVLHEMRKSLGMTAGNDRPNYGGDAFPSTELKEYFDDGPQVAWGGFSVPNWSMVAMRGGGPVIGGPGFYHDGHGEGGRYNFQKSPGLGFRTEQAWKIWDQALKLMKSEPNLTKESILMRAMAKSGVYRGAIDPAEIRLLEMGIDWYLSDTNQYTNRRDVFYT